MLTHDPDQVTWTLWFDGLCEPGNPGGTMAMGFVLAFGNGLEYPGGHAIPATAANTNNQAEYLALVGGLRLVIEAAKRSRVDRLQIHGDSMLVVNQLAGKWAVRSPVPSRHLADVRQLLAAVPSLAAWDIEWVPREHNEKADALSRQAYQQFVGQPAPRRVPDLRYASQAGGRATCR
jgi:ribonuclease HI